MDRAPHRARAHPRTDRQTEHLTAPMLAPGQTEDRAPHRARARPRTDGRTEHPHRACAQPRRDRWTEHPHRARTHPRTDRRSTSQRLRLPQDRQTDRAPHRAPRSLARCLRPAQGRALAPGGPAQGADMLRRAVRPGCPSHTHGQWPAECQWTRPASPTGHDAHHFLYRP